jgi:hypothetical protein
VVGAGCQFADGAWLFSGSSNDGGVGWPHSSSSSGGMVRTANHTRKKAAKLTTVKGSRQYQKVQGKSFMAPVQSCNNMPAPGDAELAHDILDVCFGCVLLDVERSRDGRCTGGARSDVGDDL